MKHFYCLSFVLLSVLLAGCGKDDAGAGATIPDPAGLTARTTQRGIRIEWQAVAGVDGYMVQSGYDGGLFGNISTTGATSYTDNRDHSSAGETPVRVYYRVLSLRNGPDGTLFSAGNSVTSCLWSGFADDPDLPDDPSGGTGDGSESLPATPEGLSARLSGGSVQLSWRAVPDADRYRVYRSAESGSGYVQLTSVAGTSAADASPRQGLNYYRVTACRGSAESEPSDWVRVEVSDAADEPAELTAPTGVRAVQSGNAITVSWNAVPGAARYQVWNVRPAPYDIETFETISAPATSADFEWSRMVDGTYTFWVVAADADYNLSEPSARVTCSFRSSGSGSGGGTLEKLDTPTGLEAYSRPTDSFVQISFEEVTLAYRYELYRSRSASGSYSRITAVSGTSGGRGVLVDQNPLSGTSYYKVKAVALDYLGIEDSDLSDWVRVIR